MRKIFRLLFTFLFLSIIPAVAFAVLTPPSFDNAVNYCGPIVFFWDTVGNNVPSNYILFISTTPIDQTTASFASLETLAQSGSIATQTIFFNGIATTREQNYVWTNATDKQAYYVLLGVTDLSGTNQYLAGTGGGGNPTELDVTCRVEAPEVYDVYTVVDSTTDRLNSNTLNFDTQTITFVTGVWGAQYGDPILSGDQINVDIQTDINPKSIFPPSSPPQKASLTVTVSSSNYFGNAVVGYTWDGEAYIDQGNKHNGGYTFMATPVDQNGGANSKGIGYADCNVNVVNTNDNGSGLRVVYQKLGSNQPSYGPPFNFNYYMSADSLVTWKIWDMGSQSNPNNYTLLKVVTSSAPRICGDINSSDPSGWNKNINVESWDGRNSSGTIVPNGIYYYTFDAYDYTTDHAITQTGTISFNALRIMDLASTGITNAVPLANIKYTLGGASAQAGGATIKIVISTPGTTFNIATSAGTMNYLNGTSSYTYTVGDPIPVNSANLKKVFVFQRSAGAQSETWNGFDDNGVALPNANYVFAITALDDSGNRAVDNNLNNGPIIGNITIDRTAAQTSTVTAPPAVSGISVSGTSLALTGGVVLTQPFSTLSVAMTDTGGGTISLAGSQVTLTGPTTSTIPVTVSNNGTNTVTLTFPQQSANGTYTLNIIPRDTVGNTASATVYTFTLNISATGASAAFAQSAFAYPNPVKNAAFVTFAYTVNNATTMKLEVFNILGALVYQESWATTAGALTHTWNLSNQSGNKLATGVYLYRLSASSVSATPKLQKLIIIQ